MLSQRLSDQGRGDISQFTRNFSPDVEEVFIRDYF